MKLLANSFNGCQIMDRSQQRLKKYRQDKKTDGTIKNKMFSRLEYLTDQLFEVELVKSEIEHEEPESVGFFIQQYV